MRKYSNKYVNELKMNKSSKWGEEPIEDITELKPWFDPESLFCDSNFLENLLGKKPTPGKECKDGKQ